jgi:hypothetical protein
MSVNILCEKPSETQETTINWLVQKILPINGYGKRYSNYLGAQVNCTLVAEDCAQVLAGRKLPSLVPMNWEYPEIIQGTNDNSGKCIYHYTSRKQQIMMFNANFYVEEVDVTNDNCVSDVSVEKFVQKDGIKYITSNLSTIIKDLQSISGTMESKGKDFTLTGLIYYNYKYNQDGGHFANFYRNSFGDLFFIARKWIFLLAKEKDYCRWRRNRNTC